MANDPHQFEPVLPRYLRTRRRGFALLGVAILSALLFALHTWHIASIHPRGLPGNVLESTRGKARIYVESAFAYVDTASEPPAVLVAPGSTKPTALFHLNFGRATRGLWAPTSLVGPSFRWTPPGGQAQTIPWPNEASLDAFREHLKLQYTPAALTDLDNALTAGGVVHRTIWSGYLHNAAALTLVAISVLATCRAATLLPEAARLSKSLCPKCRYELRGLAPSTVSCPECGTPLDPVHRSDI